MISYVWFAHPRDLFSAPTNSSCFPHKNEGLGSTSSNGNLGEARPKANETQRFGVYETIKIYTPLKINMTGWKKQPGMKINGDFPLPCEFSGGGGGYTYMYVVKFIINIQRMVMVASTFDEATKTWHRIAMALRKMSLCLYSSFCCHCGSYTLTGNIRFNHQFVSRKDWTDSTSALGTSCKPSTHNSHLLLPTACCIEVSKFQSFMSMEACKSCP